MTQISRRQFQAAAAGEDPAEFINSFHERITNLHIKDRKKNTTTTASGRC